VFTAFTTFDFYVAMLLPGGRSISFVIAFDT